MSALESVKKTDSATYKVNQLLSGVIWQHLYKKKIKLPSSQ